METIHIVLKMQGAYMFDDLFNFGKKRTLKQSIGFFLFHSTVIMAVMALVRMAETS